MSGDSVEVSVFSSYKSRRLEGEIINVIERNTHQFVGKIEISKNFAFVSIKNHKIHFDIFINSKEDISILFPGKKLLVPYSSFDIDL